MNRTGTERTRRTAVQVGATWDPDQRWHWPLVGGIVAYALGWVPVLGEYEVPYLGNLVLWLMPIIGLVTLAAGTALAKSVYTAAIYGARHETMAVWLARSGSACVTGWWVWAGLHTPINPTSIALLVLATIIHGIWFAMVCRAAPAAERRAETESMGRQEEHARQQLVEDWATILKNAGLPGCQILSIHDTENGYALAVTPNPCKPVTFGVFRDRTKDIAVNAAFVLAERGQTIREKDIRIEPTEAAHIHIVHVNTKRVLAGQIEYVSSEGTPTITAPREIGTYEVGGRVRLSMHDTHGANVGATGSGKSVVGNAMMGRCTEPPDSLVAVVATDKLVPFVYPWIKPWLMGLSEQPVIHAIGGQSPEHALEVLYWGYTLMRERNARNSNRSKIQITIAEPAVKIFIEEAADVCRRTDTLTMPDGRECNVAWFVNEIARAGRSAGVTVEFFNQSALFDALGKYGNEVSRNVTRRICLRTMTSYDGSATLVGLRGADVDTTTLTDNTMLVQDSIEVARAVEAKADYLEDERIHPIAVRNAQNRPGIERCSTLHQMHEYRDRWNPARHPELVAAAIRDGLTWPVRALPSEPADGGSPDTEAPVSTPPTARSNPDRADDAFDDIVANLQVADPRRPRDTTGGTSMPTYTPADRTDGSGLPDVTGDLDAMAELRRRTDSPAYALLSQIASVLAEPDAPSEFVPTRQLAVVLERVAPDAPPPMLEAAATNLGNELARLVPNLTTVRRRVEGKPTRGYTVQRLRLAHRCIARGEVLPPDTESE